MVLGETTGLLAELCGLVELYLCPRLVVGLYEESSYTVTAVSFQKDERGWQAFAFGCVPVAYSQVQCMLLKNEFLYVVCQHSLWRAEAGTFCVKDVTQTHGGLFVGSDRWHMFRYCSEQERGLIWRFDGLGDAPCVYDIDRPVQGCVPVKLPDDFVRRMSFTYTLVADGRLWSVEKMQDEIVSLISVGISDQSMQIQVMPALEDMIEDFNATNRFYRSPAGIVLHSLQDKTTCLFPWQGPTKIFLHHSSSRHWLWDERGTLACPYMEKDVLTFLREGQLGQSFHVPAAFPAPFHNRLCVPFAAVFL